MVVNDTKSYQKIENKSLLSIGKNIIKLEKMPYYNCKKLFPYPIILKSNDLEYSFDEEQIEAKYQDVI